MTVVELPRDVCPECGTVLADEAVAQPALFRHGGYGATRRDVVARCDGCGWALWRERSDVKP